MAVSRKPTTFAPAFEKETPQACGAETRFDSEGRLAQLVQSVCLTSRGSAVRIRQRPHYGSLAQLNRASDYGSEGYRFESYRSHFSLTSCLGGYQSGQMGQTVNLLVVTFGGSNPSPPTAATPVNTGRAQFQRKCGNSSVGRARPCQGRGREFESRLPLFTILPWCVSSVWLEYMPVTHGVTGSSPVRTARCPNKFSLVHFYTLSKRRLLWCVSSVWLEYMPVTHGVTGSSPVRTARTSDKKQKNLQSSRVGGSFCLQALV